MRRAGAVALVTLTFALIRVQHASPVAFALGAEHMQSVTGVEIPDWYHSYPWLAVGLVGDGLVFVSQTVDPFGFEGHTTRLASAGYRFTRIGYPLAAKVITLGVDDLAPVGLFVLSTAGIALAAWAATRFRDRVGWKAWLLVANPAVLFGYLMGTAEPLGIGLAGLALLSGSRWAAAAMATVRPDLLVTLLNRRRLAVVGGLVAVAVLSAALPLFGSIPAGHNLTWPLVDYFSATGSSVWLIAVAALGMVGVGIRRRDWACIASGLLVLCFAEPILEVPVNAWRTSGPLWIALAVSSQRPNGEPPIAEAPVRRGPALVPKGVC